MQRYTILSGVLVAALMACGAAAAATPKIGIIDVRYIVAHSKRGTAAKAALEALYNKKKAALDKERAVLAKKKEAIDNAKGEDKKTRQKLIADYQQSAAKFQQDVGAGQNEVGQRRNELLQPIGEDLKKVIATYAKANNYTLILNDTTSAVAFATDSYNLNDEIVAALNKFEGEK